MGKNVEIGNLLALGCKGLKTMERGCLSCVSLTQWRWRW